MATVQEMKAGLDALVERSRVAEESGDAAAVRRAQIEFARKAVEFCHWAAHEMTSPSLLGCQVLMLGACWISMEESFNDAIASEMVPEPLLLAWQGGLDQMETAFRARV